MRRESKKGTLSGRRRETRRPTFSDRAGLKETEVAAVKKYWKG